MIIDNPRMFRNRVNDCTRDCLECNYICSQTISHCLRLGGAYSDPSTIELLMDCVEICQVTADLMIRDSSYYRHLATLCADVCRRCAQLCEELNSDERVHHCANICFQCADSCARVAGYFEVNAARAVAAT